MLDKMGKQASVQQAKEATRATQAAGIRVTALLIIGNVGETPETINETIDFSNETDPEDVGSVGGLWIFPGTVLYQQAKRAGLIDDSFWLTNQPVQIYVAEHSLRELEQYLCAVTHRKKLGTAGFWLTRTP
jgi:anaerobic magnesium-protoporphyrin IX monomethyl ester cyclase